MSSWICNLGETPLKSGKNHSQCKEGFFTCPGIKLLSLKMPLRSLTSPCNFRVGKLRPKEDLAWVSQC